jgi:hypothetical protein
MSKLKRCPCGKIPKGLTISEGNCSKWAYVSGSCCGEWEVEFFTDYNELPSQKCLELATEAWNGANRDGLATDS